MKCEACGAGERREQLIRYCLSIRDQFVVVDHVPASVCDRCGETTLQPDVVERLQNTVWTSNRPVRLVETAVYDFT